MGVSEERLSMSALALYRWLDSNTLCAQAFYENLGVGIAGIRQDGSLAGDCQQLCSDFFSVLYGGCLRGNARAQPVSIIEYLISLVTVLQQNGRQDEHNDGQDTG